MLRFFDINIGGRYHPEIADFLLDTGVPFAFVTGYDYLVEPRHETVPVRVLFAGWP